MVRTSGLGCGQTCGHVDEDMDKNEDRGADTWASARVRVKTHALAWSVRMRARPENDTFLNGTMVQNSQEYRRKNWASGPIAGPFTRWLAPLTPSLVGK